MPTQPRIQAFFDEITGTYSYVVDDGRQAAVIDPVLDYEPKSARCKTTRADQMLSWLQQHQLQLEWILETHVHADHLSAAWYLRSKAGGKIGIGAQVTRVQQVFKKLYNLGAEFVADGRQFDHLFAEDEAFTIGSLQARALFTPGHTAADVSYQIGDAIFVGDTLFMPDSGSARCDFPGGDAQRLYQSIQRLYAFPPETRLFMCHDYPGGRRAACCETSVGEQRAQNIHLRDGVGMEEFVEFRSRRDAGLDAPWLLLPSIQVNIRAGQMPPVEGNGISYLKIPINQIGN